MKTASVTKFLCATVLALLAINGPVFGQGYWEDNPFHPETWTTGSVGIGTSTPYTRLTVAGSLGFTNGTTPLVYIYQSGVNNPERALLAHSPRHPSFGLFYQDRGDVMRFRGAFGLTALAVDLAHRRVGIGTDRPEALLDVAGTARTEVLEITGGADLAEPFDLADAGPARPGMIVSIDPAHPGRLRLARRAYDRTVAGVISGAGGIQPGMVMGQHGSAADGRHPVALTGRVYVRADASTAPIEPGDLLTTSDVPGHAMKVIDHARAQGAILGKAMASLREGRGLVLMLVTLQ